MNVISPKTTPIDPASIRFDTILISLEISILSGEVYSDKTPTTMWDWVILLRYYRYVQYACDRKMDYLKLERDVCLTHSRKYNMCRELKQRNI